MIFNSSRNGFTLVETLVAVAILAIAVAGPLVGASRALIATQVAKDQFIASYLAQEGIEYVRAFRDNAYLQDAGSYWSSFTTAIEANCESPKRCTLDPTLPMGYGTGNSIQTVSGTPSALRLFGGRYTQNSSGTLTKFTRTIQVTDPAETNEHITVTVSWDFRGTTYTVTSVDDLTPWQ